MRVGYLASNHGAVPAGRLSTPPSGAEIMRETGQNTGNLAFWRAGAALVQEPLTLLPWHWNGRDGRDEIDLLMIPAANFLNPDWDFAGLADAITAFAGPVMVFGLGAQAQLESDEVVLRPGTVRLLHALSAQCSSLFLRGPFTAGICARHGVHNVTIAGCPSITLNPSPRLGAAIEERIGRELRRLSCAGAATKDEIQPLEAALFARVCATPGSSFILQCPAELIDLTAPGRPAEPQSLARARAFFAPDAAAAAFHADFARVATCFTDADAWIARLRQDGIDYTINTRIHGTILALMAGIPSLAIGHDARIRELCSVMAIPCLPPGAVQGELDRIPDLFTALDFDGAAFDRRRRDLARLYRNHIAAAGLTPAANLATLCADGPAPRPAQTAVGGQRV
jgi:hypothetical protein